MERFVHTPIPKTAHHPNRATHHSPRKPQPIAPLPMQRVANFVGCRGAIRPHPHTQNGPSSESRNAPFPVGTVANCGPPQKWAFSRRMVRYAVGELGNRVMRMLTPFAINRCQGPARPLTTPYARRHILHRVHTPIPKTAHHPNRATHHSPWETWRLRTITKNGLFKANGALRGRCVGESCFEEDFSIRN